MTHQISFNHIENEVLPDYRIMLQNAESDADVTKFFNQTILEFMVKALGPEIGFEKGDVYLDMDREEGFSISEKLSQNKAFNDICEKSDLLNILSRFAMRAGNRITHLEKHPDKTEAKMYHLDKQ